MMRVYLHRGVPLLILGGIACCFPVPRCGPRDRVVNVQSEDGGTVQIEKIAVVVLNNKEHGRQEGLKLHYRSRHKLDEYEKLRDEAEEAWKVFRPMVEKRGYDMAFLRAGERPDGVLISKSKGYTFGLLQSKDGSWTWLNDLPDVEAEDVERRHGRGEF